MVGPQSLHLYSDPDLHLPNTDPDRRDLMLSCGASLNHCVIALAALGWQPKVQRFPNPVDPHHLAAIELTRRGPAELDIAWRRRSLGAAPTGGYTAAGPFPRGISR